MNSDRYEPIFFDRHRCQLGITLVETPGRLRVDPKGFPMQWVAAWLALVFLVIFVILVTLTSWRKEPMVFTIFAAGAAFIYPGMFGILYAISRAELAKGPLLEVHESDRTITLFRENRIIKFEDIESVFLLNGWYDDQGWERVSEASLRVRNPGNEIEQIPILLDNNLVDAKKLANRLAELVDKPVEQVKLTWKQRQRKTAP
jgi:hypothetical protein